MSPKQKVYFNVSLGILASCIGMSIFFFPAKIQKYWLLTFGPRNADYLISIIDESRQVDAWFDSQVVEVFKAILINGRDSGFLDELRLISSMDSTKGEIAALALFKLGHDQHNMINKIVNRFGMQPQGGNGAGILLDSELDPIKHSSFRHNFIVGFESSNQLAKVRRLRILSVFLLYDDVVDFIIQQTMSDDMDVRIKAIWVLGKTAASNSNTTINEIIVPHLTLIFNNSNSTFDERAAALLGLADLGWTPEIERMIVEYFTNGGMYEKVTALDALVFLDRPDRALLHATRCIFYPELSISYQALITTIFIIILHFWWVIILSIFALIITMQLKTKLKKKRVPTTSGAKA